MAFTKFHLVRCGKVLGYIVLFSILVVLIGMILCLVTSMAYVSPKHKANIVVIKNDTEAVKQNEQEYDHITYTSFIKSGNYFSKIMSEYIHVVNTTNC